MPLGGLVYAGLFAFAPLSVAVVGGVAAVGGGLAVTIAACLLARARTGTA